MEVRMVNCECGKGESFNLYSKDARYRHRKRYKCAELPFKGFGPQPKLADDPIARSK